MVNFDDYHLHDLTHTYTEAMPRAAAREYDGVSWEQAWTGVNDGWNARLERTAGTHGG